MQEGVRDLGPLVFLSLFDTAVEVHPIQVQFISKKKKRKEVWNYMPPISTENYFDSSVQFLK